MGETALSETIAYFGYGSLVNLETLRTPFLEAHPARVTGWERVWLARPKVPGSFVPIDGLAFLSVRPNRSQTIDGMLIVDHKSSLASLDEREALYQRHEVTSDGLEIIGDYDGHKQSYIYVADAVDAQPDARILRSYIDAVMQGYLTHFGEEGVLRMLNSTRNFGLEILEDRDDPIYPRPVSLQKKEADFFDSAISEMRR